MRVERAGVVGDGDHARTGVARTVPQTLAMAQRVALPSWIIGTQPVHRSTCTATVAFRDCDPMGVLWHGNYLAYVELARNTLGYQCGLAMTDFQSHQVFAPIVRSQVWHRHAVRPDELITMSVELFSTTQPRLYHRYVMQRGEDLIAEAETEQVITDHDFTLLLQQPAWLAVILQPTALSVSTLL